MNIEIKNIVLILVILYTTYNLYINMSRNERFTAGEMKNYPQMLEEQCNRTTDIYNRLRKMNAKRCDPKTKGKTQRDTINNKSLCYDDVGKEIVAKMDAESNCVMSARIGLAKSAMSAKTGSAKSTSVTSVTSTKSVKPQSQNFRDLEGPDFINMFYMNAFDNKKSSSYATLAPFDNNMNVVGTPHRFPASGPYDDIGFSSDPAFLYRLANYKPSSKTQDMEYSVRQSKN